MPDFAVNHEALAVREDRKDQFRGDDKLRAKIQPEERAGELRLIARKCESLSSKAARIGQSDLSEDLLTVAKFARKFAVKATK